MIFDLTMVRILDNTQEKKVLNAIKYLIKKPDMKQLSFAVGYFYLNGWNLIKKDFPENPREKFMKILIGRELDVPTFKEIKKGYKLRLKTDILNDLSEIKKENIENIEKINELYNLIKNKIIDIKIYIDGKLHSKLYLFIDKPEELKPSGHQTPGIAILGSSNFTVPGTLTSRELNSEFTQAEAVTQLQGWFDDLWDNHSDEFREDLIKIIETSKVLEKDKKNPIGKYVSPKQLFKYLTWIWLRGKIEPIEKEDILAQFQFVGVLNAIEMISEFNGCIVADSVGLGKSFIGATVIEEYITGNLYDWDPKSSGIDKIRKVLLILPPSLIKQWRELMFESGDFFSKNNCNPISDDPKYLKYEIIGDTSHGVLKIGEVHFLSLGKFGLMRPEGIYLNEWHKEYDMILVDEAHKFRNRWTNRWKNIQALRFKEKDIPSSFRNKFILLTATPINNNIWDAYNLIKIFSDDNFTNFKKRNIQISKLFTEYRDIKKRWKEDRKEEANLSLKAQEIKDNVFKKVIILRTRRYIMEQFGENGKITIRGKEYTFKDPIPDKVTYNNVDKKFKPYNNFIESLDEFFEELDFSYTKLYSSGYVSFNAQYGPEDTSEENKISIPISGILKFLLVKRLESSIFPFERTLSRLMSKNDLFLKLLGEYQVELNSLSGEKFFEKLKELSAKCIEVARKEELVKIFDEDDIDLDDGWIDPRLRMIENLLKLGNPNLLEILTGISREKDFYEQCQSLGEKSELEIAIKNGLMKLLDELRLDNKIFKEIKASINLTKKTKKDGSFETVGEYTYNGSRTKIERYMEPKIDKLEELIYNELNGKKIIIFTQYRDTAYYLYKSLYGWIKRQKSTLSYLHTPSDLRIEIATGDLTLNQKETIIERFAPIINNAPQYSDGREIEILISTDTLSEGINLQDADGVINYDLPWNPMKIVQRVGRVNRIGNEKDIFVKNFSPTIEMEAIIGILQKLSSKIKDITFLVGKEFYILSEEEELKPETFETKIKKLAGAKMTELEKMSQTGDATFLGDIVHQEEIAKFKLLEYIQTELKLRKDDFDDIQEYLDKKIPLYTLTTRGAFFRVYELYRGKTKTGQYILKYEDNKVIESTCNEFKQLWEAEELTDDIKIKELSKKIDVLDKHFNVEIEETFKGMKVQKGFIAKLFNLFRNKSMHLSLLPKNVDKFKLTSLKNFLPLVQMNTKEIGDFKKSLIASGAITEKEALIDIIKLVDSAYDYLKIGEDTGRRLHHKVLGWGGIR